MKAKLFRNTLVSAVLALLSATPTVTMADLGDSLFAGGGNIIGTFEGSDAGYDSQLRLVVTSESYTSSFIFPNHSTAVGTTFSFGSFAAGAPLDFQLYVENTGYTWHTGPGSGNVDGMIHANVIYDWNGTGRTFVGFEDLYGGGDQDYNDHMFSFTNVTRVTAIPEPEIYAMLGLGLGLMGWVGRRRKQQAA